MPYKKERVICTRVTMLYKTGMKRKNISSEREITFIRKGHLIHTIFLYGMEVHSLWLLPILKPFGKLRRAASWLKFTTLCGPPLGGCHLCLVVCNICGMYQKKKA